MKTKFLKIVTTFAPLFSAALSAWGKTDSFQVDVRGKNSKVFSELVAKGALLETGIEGIYQVEGLDNGGGSTEATEILLRELVGDQVNVKNSDIIVAKIGSQDA